MHDVQRRAAIRLGDTTDHGGIVRTAFVNLLGEQRAVTGEGHWVWCPACKGNFRILPSSSGRKHEGRSVAYEGDMTECGARLLALRAG